MNNDLQQATLDMAKMMNYKLHAEQLFVPVIEEFKLFKNNNPEVILEARSDNLLERLVSDGYIKDGDFENRIDLANDKMKKYLAENGCENIENCLKYYKDYFNGIFNFKIYVCDIIFGNNTKRILRQFIAYFVEPKMHDFYQLILSTAPFIMPTDKLIPGVIDLENDKTTNNLDYLLKFLMDNLKYKNKKDE